MRLVVGSNISSLQAQRRLGQNSFELSGVFERLSTGQRINRASDDAAGLAVEVKLRNQSRVFRRASLNVGDATSMLSIADGALGQVSDMLTRMAELATQAANGPLGSQQRRTLDKEFAALDREIRRITASTKFNGRGLFAGEKSSNAAQVENIGFNFSGTAISSNGRFTLAYTAGNARIINNETGESRALGGVGLNGNVIDDNGNVFFKEQGSAFFGLGRLFKYDYASGEMQVLTNEADPDAMSTFALSADGSTIAFVSTTNYTDGAGIDSASGLGIRRLYVMDVATGIIRTSGEEVGAITSLRLSSDGSQVAGLTSSVGGDAFGQTEVVSASFSPDGISNFERRTTSSSAASLSILGVSNDGQVILQSQRDFTGGNAGGFQQVFSVGANNTVSQVTNFESLITLNAVTSDSRATAVYFVSNANIDGQNPTGFNQLFQIDLLTGQTSQMTDYTSQALTSPASSLSISADGRFISTRASAFNLSFIEVAPASENIDFEVGQGTAGGIVAQLEAIRTSLSGLGTLAVSSGDSARFALDVLGDNIAALNGFRGRIGASLSRLQIANSLLDSQAVEIDAAASRIRDADVAAEAANLTRLSILQNAGAAVLAQANQQPALVLTLLNESG